MSWIVRRFVVGEIKLLPVHMADLHVRVRVTSIRQANARDRGIPIASSISSGRIGFDRIR